MALTPKLRKAQGDNLSDTGATSIGASDTSIQMSTISLWSSNGGKAVIDRGNSKEEVVYASGKSGSNLSITTDGRGLDGTSAVAHDAGATIESLPSSYDWNDLIDALSNVLSVTDGTVDSTKVPVVSGGKSITISASATASVSFPTSGTLATVTGAETLTNKRITKRVASQTSTGTVTPNSDSYDVFDITALAVTGDFQPPSGTPTDSQSLIVRIKDNGTARALSWSGTGYAAGGVSLPSTTTTGKYTHLGFMYVTSNSLNKWLLLASVTEA